MHVPLIEAVAEKILEEAKRYLKDYIHGRFATYLAQRGKTIDNLDKKTAVWNFTGPNGEAACTDAFGVNGNWFYKVERDFEKSRDKGNEFRIVHKDSETVRQIFRRIGNIPDEGDFISYFIPYIKNLDIPYALKSYQIGIIREYEPEIVREADGIDWDELAISTNFTTKLVGKSGSNAGTKWRLYFYGYETVGEHPRTKDVWPLVRLTLEFRTLVGQNDLSVSIINTENRKHYNYKGKTDFSSSTDKVLVLNLRTREANSKRQLNIKLMIDGAWGSLFMGQYLNYEAGTGRIISGDLILEQAREVNPVPYTFYVRDPIEATEGYDLIKHLTPLLPMLQSRFRQSYPVDFDPTTMKWQTVNASNAIILDNDYENSNMNP